MAQRNPEHTEIDQIVQLIAPLAAVEHDYVVQALTERWGKPDQRQPWVRDKVVTEDRRVEIEEVERKVAGLAEALPPDEQDELLEELKLVWLRRALGEAEESVKKYGTIPAEEVFAKLQAKYERMKAEQ